MNAIVWGVWTSEFYMKADSKYLCHYGRGICQKYHMTIFEEFLQHMMCING